MTLMSSKRDWEIVHIPEKPPIPPHQQPTVNVYAALIDPKHTNTLVRKLNQIAPLENLRHVKRVRKQHLEKGGHHQSMANTEYKGPWEAKKIKNPNYKGKWKAPMIDNPEFKDDPNIYVYPNLKYVGIELWQVKSGTLFDNVLICDDPEYAKKLADETWGKHKDAEKAAFDEAEKNMEDEESKIDPADSDADDEDEDDEAEGKTQLSVILCLACENGCQQDSIPNGVLELISSYQFANLLHYQKKSGKNSANYGQLHIIHQPSNIDGITGFSEEDSHSIHNFMKLTVDMAKSGDGQVVNAAIIVDPSTKQVIASACDQVRSQNSLTNQAGVETCFFEQQEAYTCHPIASSVEIHKKLLSNPSSAESRQLYTGVACLYPWRWAEQQLASCFRHPLRHAAIVAIEYSAARDRHLFPGIGHTGSNSTQMDLVQYSLRGSPVKRQKTNLEDMFRMMKNWILISMVFIVNQSDHIYVQVMTSSLFGSLARCIYLWIKESKIELTLAVCAMALVHQRVRRIFYAFPNPNEGALGSVHRLQGEKSLNHHYAVFRVLLPAEILEKERKTIVATCDDDKNNTT
ncbi:unnamed protein product [Camellia sinensis]